MTFLQLACIGLFTISLMAQPPGPDQDVQRKPAPQEGAVIRSEVDLVNVLFAVRGKKTGELIPNLEQKDFRVLEDGKEQKIVSFTRESDLPLTLGLLIDISASQGNLIDIERLAASQFFSSVVRKKDEAFLISFGRTTDLLQDYTNSPKLLTAALKDLRGDPQDVVSPIVNPGPIPQYGTPKGTLLYDAIYLASDEKLKREVGRKAIVLITDGEDQGSTYTLQQSVQEALKADAIVYSIYYVDRQFYGGFGGGGEGALEKISQQTGGRVFKVDKKHTLADIFKEIQNELRSQYSISYTPSKPLGDNSFRKIEIKVDNSDDKVQARSGYFASKREEE